MVYLIRFSGLPGFYTLVQASTCVYEAVGFREEPRVYDDYVRALLFEVAVSKGTNNKDSL